MHIRKFARSNENKLRGMLSTAFFVLLFFLPSAEPSLFVSGKLCTPEKIADTIKRHKPATLLSWFSIAEAAEQVVVQGLICCGLC